MQKFEVNDVVYFDLEYVHNLDLERRAFHTTSSGEVLPNGRVSEYIKNKDRALQVVDIYDAGETICVRDLLSEACIFHVWDSDRFRKAHPWEACAQRSLF